ncbi:MAG: DeoR/GlpR family DNA-binding transcription regulator [Actinobacteria bacterium]|nr:DeoR/GlpR family DNA-binding transcription regulator [Actinomycetota bacterium]
MKFKERRQEIIELLSNLEEVSIDFLAEKFNVSGMTIHRDLQELEEKGYLKKTIGGAIKINDFLVQSETPFAKKLKIKNNEKIAIAKRAMDYIKNGDSIIIDAGTTNYLLVKEIVKSDIEDLTIITNNIIAQIELVKKEDNLNIIATGGNIRRSSYSSTGIIAERMLERVTVDKAFITTKGISENGDLYDPTDEEGAMKQYFIRRAREKILIVDSSKFGILGLHIIGNINDFDILITDNKIPQKYIDFLKDLDIKLDIVNL